MQERDSIPQRKTLILVALSILALVASAAGAHLVLKWRLSELHHRDSEQAPRTTPRELSGLEQTPATDDSAALDLTEQHRQLTSYGWVDREHGIVRVPIDTAIRDYVEQEQR